MPHSTSPQAQMPLDRDLCFLESVMRTLRGLQREYGDDPEWQKDIASVLRIKGIYCLKTFDVSEAKQAFEQALALSRKINDPQGVATAQDLLLTLPPSHEEEEAPREAEVASVQGFSPDLPQRHEEEEAAREAEVASAQDFLLDLPLSEELPSVDAPPSPQNSPSQKTISPVRRKKPRLSPPSPRFQRSRLQNQTLAFSHRPPHPPKAGLFVPKELLPPAAFSDIGLSRGPPPSS